jgi:hypothetical protein
MAEARGATKKKNKSRKRKAGEVVEPGNLERRIEELVVKPLKERSFLRRVASKLAQARRADPEQLMVISPPSAKYHECTSRMNGCMSCAMCNWAVSKGEKASRGLGMRVGSPTIEELDKMGYALVYTKEQLVGAMHCSCAMLFVEWSRERDTPLEDMDDLLERTRQRLSARSSDTATQQTINVADYV